MHRFVRAVKLLSLTKVSEAFPPKTKTTEAVKATFPSAQIFMNDDGVEAKKSCRGIMTENRKIPCNDFD
jgi:hypothetical protein